MVDDNRTKIYCVIDETGSMSGLVSEVVQGFNNFMNEQQDLGIDDRVEVSLKFFNTEEVRKVHDWVPLDDVTRLEPEDYNPNACTPLLDVVGDSINELGKDLANIPEHERPGNVLFFVFTDGRENSSREYSWDQVRDMIETQQETYNWEFLFAEAGPDSWGQGERLGTKSVRHQKGAEGVKASYDSYSQVAADARSKVSEE